MKPLAFLIIFACSAVFSHPQEDLVTDLPGLEQPVPYDQYSGYLSGTPGRQLHYWFIESSNNPELDPLILWLNGGPGCSSVSGLLTENGPFTVSEDSQKLLPNPYAWNRVGNILFLESPACVGFSYDENGKCRTGDDEVAEMNYLALLDFFKKFPSYAGRNFFITGESYGGIYIPTLSVRIVQGGNEFPGNFKGYAIGNGLLNYELNDNSLMYYSYYHGLIGDENWERILNSCCPDIGLNEAEKCLFEPKRNSECLVAVYNSLRFVRDRNLNMYNLYGECYHPSEGRSTTSSRYHFDIQNLFQGYKMLKSKAEMTVPCIDDARETNYLNRMDVRKALHIPDFVNSWETCSDKVFRFYKREYNGTIPQIEYLQNRNIRGLVYNGDFDMACNFLGNEWSIDTLNLKMLKYRSTWTVNNQIAGYVSQYKNLDFVTVKGAGHMVPTDKPVEALHMLDAFVNNMDY